MKTLFQKVMFPISMLALLMFTCGMPGVVAQASTTSPVQTVSLSLTIAEAINVSVTPNTLTFPSYVPNTAVAASSPLTVTTSYSSNGTEVGAVVCASFATANALINSGPTILASNVFATITGTASTGLGAPNDGFPPSAGALAFTTQSGKGCSAVANSVVVWQHNVAACPACSTSLPAALTGSASNTVALSINSPQTTPGSYAGSLSIQGLLQ